MTIAPETHRPVAAATVPPELWRVRLKQGVALLVGLVAAAAMMMLGIWQLEVYQEAGDRATQERIAAPPMDLRTVAPAGQAPNSAYGHTVTFSGHYLPQTQILVPDETIPGEYRVLIAFQQDDGPVVPVVRGVWSGAPESVPEAPTGTLGQRGVLMPAEPNDNRVLPPGQLSTVNLSALAQTWPAPMVSGFVTLSEPLAQTQGLAYELPEMPREGGELRNGAYAVQWWLFAAFAVALGIKMARDFHKEYMAEVAAAVTEQERQESDE
ncbi:SURF1 family protein [Microlunatus sp. Y2014]|uniref:SURF1 family protein n=1 Tax=Microlunatus sp. Y2014 TaxID=3418488 RepID=UPI003DA7411E